MNTLKIAVLKDGTVARQLLLIIQQKMMLYQRYILN